MNQFPKEALSQHMAVLGKTGSGKSYAVRGIVEGLLDDQARVCIVDPTSAWHGLRSSVTGKSAGYPVVIFGGDHADLPLSGAHGEAIAETIGTSSTPAIIDTRLMRTGERVQFFTDFAEGILRKNKGPLHLVIDEAHIFAPQGKVSDPRSGAMLHAANNLVSLGRSRGLRIILITQRPAKLHKDSLTQVETLVAMRLIAPQDRKAVEEWIKDNADDVKGREILSSLATLKTGDGWVWSPELNILERMHFPKIKTFDTGKSPDGSEAGAQVLAPIDVKAISAKLQTVAADALANDPTELKKKLAELQRQINTHKCLGGASPAELDAANNRGFQAGYSEGRDSIVSQLEAYYISLDHWHADMPKPPIFKHQAPRITPAKPMNGATLGKSPAPVQRSAPNSGASSSEVGSGGKRRILTALAQYPEGMNQRKLSILVDISPKGGTWRTYMAELRGSGWIEGGRDHMRITDAGLKALGSYDPLPTGDELVQYWRQRLGDSGKRAIFDTVVEAYPRSISVDEVSEATGIARAGGTWRTYMAELRGLGIIEGKADLKASEDLFS